jgi:hypothetical protein
MENILQGFGGKVTGVLRGFDRVRFRGYPRVLMMGGGIVDCLRHFGKKIEDFKTWAEERTEAIVASAEEIAASADRPWQYLNNSSEAKDQLARKIASEDGIKNGLICGFSAVEPCRTYKMIFKSGSGQPLLVPRQMQCKHVYHYYMHPKFGLMHVRLQTWLPYNVTVNINGREWLARQMDNAGIKYQRDENCFRQISNLNKAQKLMDLQLRQNWPTCLDAAVAQSNPALESEFSCYPLSYHWLTQSSEWATDIMFSNNMDEDSLERLIRYGIIVVQSSGVFRYFGNKLTLAGKIRQNFNGRIVTKYILRPEGACTKHWLNTNSIKIYLKSGCVLRVEITINDPSDFRVYRRTQGLPDSKMDWKPLRKGIADMYRRAQVSDAANNRYIEGLNAVAPGESLQTLLDPLTKRVKLGKSFCRALNPFSGEDVHLLQAIARGEFTINGFRNRDIKKLLFGGVPISHKIAKRQSRIVTRYFRLLRAHGVIAKVPKTHRYLLTDFGRKAISAVLAAKKANSTELLKMAA